MEKIFSENIVSGLDQLEKTSIWIFITLIVILISSFQNENDIEIGKIKLSRKKSGMILYFVLCALNLQMLKVFQGIFHSFNSLENKEEIIVKMQTHHWVFNPFSMTKGIIGYITDNIGLICLIVLWWLGLSLSSVEVLRDEESNNTKMLIPTLFFTYLILGLFSLILIQDLMLKIGGYEIRIISQFIGILIGVFLFYTISKKHSLLKKLFS